MDNLATDVQDPRGNPGGFAPFLLGTTPTLGMVIDRWRNCGESALFTANDIPGFDNQINEIWAQVITGESVHVSHLPVGADEDIESGANPLRNAVLDRHMEFE